MASYRPLILLPSGEDATFGQDDQDMWSVSTSAGVDSECSEDEWLCVNLHQVGPVLCPEK